MKKQTIFKITEYLARASPFLLLLAVVIKLDNLNCINTLNKMWMLIVLIAIWTYAVNKYCDASYI